jgi:hypothetical protein
MNLKTRSLINIGNKTIVQKRVVFKMIYLETSLLSMWFFFYPIKIIISVITSTIFMNRGEIRNFTFHEIFHIKVSNINEMIDKNTF